MIIRRENKFKTNNFLDLFRPCLPSEIIGQETSKRIIINGLETQQLDHTMLLVGPAGCGKTTAARIIALGLNCEAYDKSTSTPCLECKSCKEILNDSSVDFVEINVGKESGKAAVDHIINTSTYAPMRLRYKVIIFDEAHQLTTAAKDLLLKPIEDGFAHVYYIFCTNQPEKLKTSDKKGGSPFIDRCSTLSFNPINYKEIHTLLENICVFQGAEYNPEVLDIIATECTGVPRKAVNWLSQVFLEGSWDKKVLVDIIGIIDEYDSNVVDLYKALNSGYFNKSVTEYDKLKATMPPESIRITIAFFFLRALKSATDFEASDLFSDVISMLREPVYEAGKVADIAMVNLMYKITKKMRG